jgi:hypothetical protein
MQGLNPNAVSASVGMKDNEFHRLEGWVDRWIEYIQQLTKDLPSGAGFDNGTKIDIDSSHAEKLVFTTSFHHMNEFGFYGWTDHVITVTPSFTGINLRVTGRNHNGIKEYILETFEYALTRETSVSLQGIISEEGL